MEDDTASVVWLLLAATDTNDSNASAASPFMLSNKFLNISRNCLLTLVYNYAIIPSSYIMTLFNMLVTAVGSTAKFAEERLYGFVDLLFAIESDRSSTYSSSSATASQGSRPRSVLRSTTRSHLHSSKVKK